MATLTPFATFRYVVAALNLGEAMFSRFSTALVEPLHGEAKPWKLRNTVCLCVELSGPGECLVCFGRLVPVRQKPQVIQARHFCTKLSPGLGKMKSHILSNPRGARVEPPSV